MSIILKGVITNELPVLSGTTKAGKEWRRASYVMEYEQGDYPKSIMFDVMNDKIDVLRLKVGENVELYLDGHVREFNGRFFNNIEAWRCSREQIVGAKPYPLNPAPSAPVNDGMPEDPQLPF